jgi:hypothetical protein
MPDANGAAAQAAGPPPATELFPGGYPAFEPRSRAFSLNFASELAEAAAASANFLLKIRAHFFGTLF